MTKRFIKILFLGIIVIFLFSQTGILANLRNRNITAYANGDLTIDWGVPSGNPIFVVNNFLPGDPAETRTVKVTNNSTTNRPIGLQSIKQSESLNFAQVLIITILKDGVPIFPPQKLADFFTAAKGPSFINFSTLAPGQTAIYTFTVNFPTGANDNDYQNASVIFDLTIGIAFQLPQECEGKTYNDEVIFGTQNRDVLNGHKGNNIILGFEGNDVINGQSGDDCLIGGPGNDIIHGQNGNDIIFGNEGDDRIDGDNGDDIIYGGLGNDIINGNNGNDTLIGGSGNDSLNGGPGSDTCQLGKFKSCEIVN
ncbi:MAG: calcium-binding protein [Candidatus Gottesmanbacteria bacterium]